jgi:hypothetical protein
MLRDYNIPVPVPDDSNWGFLSSSTVTPNVILNLYLFIIDLHLKTLITLSFRKKAKNE